MKVCMRCGLLYWDQSERCIVCEKKLMPKYEEKLKQKFNPGGFPL